MLQDDAVQDVSHYRHYPSTITFFSIHIDLSKIQVEMEDVSDSEQNVETVDNAKPKLELGKEKWEVSAFL